MYEVGKILYTVYEDRFKIFPLRVVEQVTTKTIDGEKTEFFVEIPSKKEKTTVNLKKVNKVFTNIEETRSYLMKNAEISINEIVNQAIDLEKEYFGAEDKTTSNIKLDFDPESTNQDKKEQQKVEVDLGDGTIAKINMENVKQVLGDTNID